MCFKHTQGSIEEKIYQRQIIKQNLSGAVIDSMSNKNVQFTDEELKVNFQQNNTIFRKALSSQTLCKKEKND